MSLLFTPRDSGSPEAHAKMCAVLLETYEASAHQIGHRFTQDTWESLLKVMMGICDHLLRLPELMTPLANLLCPLLIKVRSIGLNFVPLFVYADGVCISLFASFGFDPVRGTTQCGTNSRSCNVTGDTECPSWCTGMPSVQRLRTTLFSPSTAARSLSLALRFLGTVPFLILIFA